MLPTVSTVLDDLRRLAGSDAAAGRLVGISRAAFFLARDRRRLPDAAIVAAAAALNLPAGYLLACIHADVATSQAVKSAWHEVAAKLRPETTPLTAPLYYVKPEGAENQRQPEKRENDKELPTAGQRRIAGKPRKTDSALHCLALSEEKKSALVVLQWCLMVARLQPDSPRLAWYVSRWNVPGKIAAAARDGTLDATLADCPPIDLCHLPAALAAIAESDRYNSADIIREPAAPCLPAIQSADAA